VSTPRTRPARSASARPTRAALVRRRLVALALLVVLVVAMVLLGQVVVGAVQPLLAGGDQPGEGKTAPPTPEAGGPPQDCTAKALELTVRPARPEVDPGEMVALAVTLRHVGARPCLVDGSDAVRQVLVRAGEETVWSSAHCATGEKLLLMSRGDEVSATVRWDQHRSVEGCAPDQPLVPPGTYTVVASVAGIEGATSTPATVVVAGSTGPAGGAGSVVTGAGGSGAATTTVAGVLVAPSMPATLATTV
jgi:hypothetical protein